MCPLCSSIKPSPFATVHDREYFRCPRCMLTFMAPEHHLSSDEELAHYRRHRNDPSDPAYRRWLSQLSEPLIPLLPAGAHGLDYGSGPGPTLSVMLQEQGFHMSIYDPFFASDETALWRTYDFITCTETVEHFHHPAAEFQKLNDLLRPGGLLAVMTQIQTEDERFPTWWYVRDPTHVCFYKRQTMQWIADRWKWRIQFPRPNVTLFRNSRVCLSTC